MCKVSVLIPTYNTKEEWLKESIESILKQTFQDFEIIILDEPFNGSVVCGYVVAQYLDGDDTSHQKVNCLIYDSHSSNSDESVYSVSVIEHLSDIFFIITHNSPFLPF